MATPFVLESGARDYHNQALNSAAKLSVVLAGNPDEY
jgi:hypothetical protein